MYVANVHEYNRVRVSRVLQDSLTRFFLLFIIILLLTEALTIVFV